MILRIIGFSLAALLMLFACYAFFFGPTPPSKNLIINSPAGFQYEIASSSAARTLGLSGRSDVPSKYGMLFVFPEPGLYGFWMKDMLVPIDMVWLDEDGTIVGLNASVDPSTYPKAFYPPTPVRYILETRAGEAGRQGWMVGTRISLPL